jgi:hypothetical protein
MPLVRNAVVPDEDIVVGETGDSRAARAVGVTGHATVATELTVSSIGVALSWIGSVENRLGGWPQRRAARNPLRVIV